MNTSEIKLNNYLEMISRIYKLPTYSPALLRELLKYVDADGIITLSKWRKQNIAKEVGINVYTVNNALQVYKRTGIVNWEAVSVFTLNSNLFGKEFHGSYDGEFKKLNLRLVIEFPDGVLGVQSKVTGGAI